MPPTPLDPVTLLQDLVAIPSVNPMGRDVSGEIYLEGRMTEYLVRFFQQLGVDVATDEVCDGRANVLAHLPGADGAPVILLDAHQDTVPVDGMTIPPFEPVIDGDRLYGRGACDVKGGMAAMLTAFARLVQERPAGAASVIMCCTCDEEATAAGAGRLADHWRSGGTGDWWTQRPDLCIVAEPTELDVVVAHRGASRWKIRTTGRACHSSDPSQGSTRSTRWGTSSRHWRSTPRAARRVTPHPLCGGATLASAASKGVSVNTVPDECTIEIDRRVIPGEDGWAAIHDVEAFLRSGRRSISDAPPWLVGEASPMNTTHRSPGGCSRRSKPSPDRIDSSEFRTAPTAPASPPRAFPPWCSVRDRLPRPTPKTNGSRSPNCARPRTSTTAPACRATSGPEFRSRPGPMGRGQTKVGDTQFGSVVELS